MGCSRSRPAAATCARCSRSTRAIADHLTCIAASLMELGAMTRSSTWSMIRDYIYEHLEA